VLNDGSREILYCSQAYVTWYSLSNFFVPFLVLIFCYSNMCVALWTNFKNKKEAATCQQQQQQHQQEQPKEPSEVGGGTLLEVRASNASAKKASFSSPRRRQASDG